MICCCRWFTRPQRAASRMCQGWKGEDMFGAEMGQCPVATGEIKAHGCNNQASPTRCILRRFEFGGVF